MSLPNDLLELSGYLSRRERSKPKQSSLRRSISTAYYALFHFIIQEACKQMFGGSDASRFVRSVAARAFEHGHMKDCCKHFASGNVKKFPVAPVGATNQLIKDISRTFNLLQEARHKADYDTFRNVTRSEATTSHNLALQAIGQMQRLKDVDPDAYSQFLTLLLFKARD